MLRSLSTVCCVERILNALRHPGKCVTMAEFFVALKSRSVFRSTALISSFECVLFVWAAGGVSFVNYVNTQQTNYTNLDIMVSEKR